MAVKKTKKRAEKKKSPAKKIIKAKSLTKHKGKTVKKAAAKTAKKSMRKSVVSPVVIPSPHKRRRKVQRATKTYLSQRELNHFRKVILEEKKDILENQKRLRDSLVDNNTGEYVGENATYSMHMAEQGTDEMERQKAFLFMQRDEKYLSFLDNALKRIADKTYGICVMCKNDPLGLCKTCPFIPKSRLEVVPVTQHCVECKALKSN